MQMLYDSEAFVVVHVDVNAVDGLNAHNAGRSPRNGFEIVDKRCNLVLYLDGTWAACFQAQINQWQEQTPTQDEVEAILESYARLAQMPLIIH